MPLFECLCEGVKTHHFAHNSGEINDIHEGSGKILSQIVQVEDFARTSPNSEATTANRRYWTGLSANLLRFALPEMKTAQQGSTNCGWSSMLSLLRIFFPYWTWVWTACPNLLQTEDRFPDKSLISSNSILTGWNRVHQQKLFARCVAELTTCS